MQVAFARNAPAGAVHHAMRLDRIAMELAKTYFFGGDGIAADIPGGVAAFVQVMPDAAVPDTQLLLAGAPLTAGPYLKPFTQPFADGFGGRVVMLHPESRGELKLASADPAAPIRIKQNFMSTDREWKTLRAGFRVMREIMAQARHGAVHRQANCCPAPATPTPTSTTHIRNTAITLHHPLGTCKMGPRIRRERRGRSGIARARRRRPARGRRLGDARSRQRQHQLRR